MTKPVKLALANGKETRFVFPDEIIYCQSEGNYTILHFDGYENLMLTKSLKEISKNLPEEDFFRIHNSYLINLTFVTKYVENVEDYIMMTDGTKLPVARRKKTEFFARFKKL